MKDKYFLDLIDKQQNILVENNKKLNLFSILRLVCILISICFFILGATTNELYFIFMAIFFVTFIVFAVIHKKYFVIAEKGRSVISVCNDYLDRLTDRWKNFSDTGADFIEEKNYFETDLDIFGKASLFQYINLSKTVYGRKYLADSLKNKKFEPVEFKKRQEAIAELSKNIDKNIEIESSIKRYKKRSGKTNVKIVERIVCEINNDFHFTNKYIYFAMISTIALIVTFILALVKVIPFTVPFLFFVLNFGVTFIMMKQAGPLSSSLSQIEDAIGGYDYIFKTVEELTFDTQLLNETKENIDIVGYKSIKKLRWIAALVSSRNNFFGLFIMNGLFCCDFWCLYLFKKWQQQFGEHFEIGIKSIGYLEQILSLAVIGVIKENNVVGSLGDKISFEGLKHPLIKEDECISNNFTFTGFNVITGSNMSGKTTFMRSVGLNYILFNAGASVNAKSFKAGHYALYTSMRANDNVSEGISTFYAEILRIKEMIVASKKREDMLVLIDEIFKGTNSNDRIIGATKAIEKLNLKYIQGIVTTHDFELCSIEGIKNFHFLEYYEDNKIRFDYKIKEGRSTTTNAIYLMRMSGIIDEE